MKRRFPNTKLYIINTFEHNLPSTYTNEKILELTSSPLIELLTTNYKEIEEKIVFWKKIWWGSLTIQLSGHVLVDPTLTLISIGSTGVLVSFIRKAFLNSKRRTSKEEIDKKLLEIIISHKNKD